jgi:hypothetical protein
MAGLAAQEGKPDEAKVLLLAALDEHRGHPFEETVRRFARAVGVPLKSE